MTAAYANDDSTLAQARKSEKKSSQEEENRQSSERNSSSSDSSNLNLKEEQIERDSVKDSVDVQNEKKENVSLEVTGESRVSPRDETRPVGEKNETLETKRETASLSKTHEHTRSICKNIVEDASDLNDSFKKLNETSKEVKETKEQFCHNTTKNSVEKEKENFVHVRCDVGKSNEDNLDSMSKLNNEDSKCAQNMQQAKVTRESSDFLKEKLRKLSLDDSVESRDSLYECDDENVELSGNCRGDASIEESIDDTFDPGEELNFYEAVRAGDARSVATLFARDEVQNPDEPDWNVSGDPPLLVAATNHCLPVLSVLLANGCDPAVRSPRGETALHRAILNGSPGTALKLVGELLKYGCPSGVKEAGGGLTALHILSRQLAHAQGSKSLHHDFDAALKTLDLLARAGPVNAMDHQGRSALHILASSTMFDNNHRMEIESLIETLLAAGADPALKNDRGETALHECLECGALNTAFLLVPHTPTGVTSRYGETPLHIASRKNYVDMVAKLLEHGEDPSLQDAGGNTPLHLASARGFHQTVSLLVTSPLAQLEKVNVEGLTALQVAAESGFVNAVRILLKAGADPSQTVHYRDTTLHRHPDISLLIDHELTRRRQLAA